MKKEITKAWLTGALGFWALMITGCSISPSGEGEGGTGDTAEASTLTAGGTSSVGLEAMNAGLSALASPSSSALVKSTRLYQIDSPDDGISFECEMFDSDGDSLSLDDPEADFSDIAEVVCEGPCNEDGTGNIVSAISFDEDGGYLFDLTLEECQVDACDGSTTISGTGEATFTADCQASWEMEITTDDGNEIVFDLSADTSTGEPGECAELACDSFSGSVTVNGEEISIDEVCTAAEEGDESDICGSDDEDESDDEESDDEEDESEDDEEESDME